jgi:DUF438 domain-containing protein
VGLGVPKHFFTFRETAVANIAGARVSEQDPLMKVTINVTAIANVHTVFAERPRHQQHTSNSNKDEKDRRHPRRITLAEENLARPQRINAQAK